MEQTGIKLSRKEVIDGYKWREGLIPLVLSKHAQRRIEERVEGEFIIVPTVVRITKQNICSGRSKDGKKLSSVKIRLDYKNDKWMFLVVCPNSGVVKTLYINYKDAKKEQAARQRQGIEEGECCVEENYVEEGKAQDNGAIVTGTAGEGFNERVIYGDMVRKTPSFRNLWGLLG